MRQLHYNGTNCTETIYKSIEYIQIQKTELSDVGLKAETMVLYSYRFLTFSEEEIIGYLEKSNNDRLVPFVDSNDFRKVKEEFRKAFSKLREANLIKPVADKVSGDVRFIISENSLRDLINEIWVIHKYQLSILNRKMNYVGAPNEREKQWLERIFGKEEAGRIISQANLKRVSNSSERQKVKEIRDNIDYDNKVVERFKKHVSGKYEKVIKEYGFPTDLIEDVCIGRIFH